MNEKLYNYSIKCRLDWNHILICLQSYALTQTDAYETSLGSLADVWESFTLSHTDTYDVSLLNHMYEKVYSYSKLNSEPMGTFL